MMKILTADADTLARVDAVLEGAGADPGDLRLLTQEDVAESLGVSRQTVWRMLQAGRLPAVKTVGDRLRIPAAAVQRYVAGKGAV